MKKKVLSFIFLFIFGLGLGGVFMLSQKSVSAQEIESVSVLNDNDYRLTKEYLDYYSIPTSKLTFSNNGGELSGNELSKAFDRNFYTCFKSSQDNNVSYTDPNGVETPNFLNHIDVEFDSVVTIDRIMYGCESASTTRGYPTQLNIYYQANGEWQLAGNYSTTETSKMVIFNLDTAVSTQKIRFEYVKVVTYHKYVATCRELICLQQESNQDYEDYTSLFANYSQTKVNQKFSTWENLIAFENKFKNNINYESVFKPNFDRAKQVVLGNIYFDAKKEFSTAEDSKNKIEQHGNIVSYVRNTLKMNSFGTNRQTSGIAGLSGQEITIYVEAEPNDPLPKIQFSQTHGHWSRWLDGEQQLVRGKNTFTVPYFINDNYTVSTLAGGAIYIVNPYTSEQQSGNVKLYFENGDFFPVFKIGDDEQVFKNELNDYAEKLSTNPQTTLDICEIVSNHVIFSGRASGANNVYKTYSPKKAVENWNTYMEELLTFGGVELDESSASYNPLNKFVNVNIRVSQPWSGAAAYAYTEHIGIYTSWESTGFISGGFGWGMSHEIGHMMDIPARTIGESTNNMWAKYNETAIEKTATRGDFLKTTQSLSSDLVDTSGFFNTNRLNFLVWWHIESYQKGYWGHLENCYRGTNENLNLLLKDNDFATKLKDLNKTETMVLYSSISTGIDLSYYFERWGFNLNTSEAVFNYNSSSQNFKDCLQFALEGNVVSNTLKPKLWYQDAKQYNYVNSGTSYSQADIVQIQNVFKTSNGYSILLDNASNSNHLGYEILQGNETDGYKVIGFTYTNTFVDTTVYDSNYTPSYKVRAYDRQFCSTSLSESKSLDSLQENVCKIGDTFYTSLADAINNAKDDDVIIMLKSSLEQNMTLNKSSDESTKTVTIKISEDATESIYIKKIESGNLFTISSGCTLTILGSSNYRLIIDGNNVSQTGALVAVAGVLNAQYADFVNSVNLSNGGAIISLSGNITLTNCTIENNQAQSGAGIYVDYAQTKVVLNNVTIANNTALSHGSAIASKGNVTIENCQIHNNYASQNGTIYNYNGGIVYLRNSLVDDNNANNGGALYLDGYTEIYSSSLYNNTAKTNGGAIYYSTTVGVRKVKIENSNIYSNLAENGNSIFVNSGTMELKLTNIYDNASIYLNGGNIVTNSNCTINANILINSGSILTLNGGTFSQYEDCVFQPINYQNGMTLFEVSGFSLSPDILSTTQISSSKLNPVIDENKVILVPSQVTVSIMVGSNSITEQYEYGEKLTLNFDADETHYIKDFTNSNGDVYSFGEEIILTEDLTLFGNIANKLKVNLVYKDKTETNYIRPYEKFTLPTLNKADSKINAWITDEEASYLPNQNVYLSKDTTIYAKYEHLFKVSLVKQNGEVVNDYYLSYLSTLELPSLDEKDFVGWTLNGTLVQSLTIDGDLTLVAEYKQNSITLYLILCVIAILILLIVITLIILKKKSKAKNMF